MTKTGTMPPDTSSTLWLERVLYDILHGEKPPIDINDDQQGWLYSQLKNMYRAGMLSAEPESYIFLIPEENPQDKELQKYKGVTTVEALPKAITTESADTLHFLQERDIHNAKTLGEDYAYLYNKDPLDQIDDADIFILPNAGIASLYQLVRTMNARDEGHIDLTDKLFVIQDRNQFWKPFLDFVKLSSKDDNFVVSKTKRDTAELVKERTTQEQREKIAKHSTPVHPMQPGDVVFAVTGNIKKTTDYRKVFAERRTGIKVRNFQQTFSKSPRDADEQSYSYIGNLLEKFEAFFNLVKDTYGPDEFVKELTAKGYDLDHAFALFDDGGIATEENLTAGPEFSNTTKARQNPYMKHGPGPEIKGILGAVQNQPYKGTVGVVGLFERIKDAAFRISMERGAQGKGDMRLSLKAHDQSSSVTVPLKELVERIKDGVNFEDIIHSDIVHWFSARTDNYIVFKPSPEDAVAFDSKNFMVPRHDPKGRTMASIPKYVERHSATAQIAKAISRTFDLKPVEAPEHALAQAFSEAHEKQLKLATQRSIIKGDPGMVLPGTSYNIQDDNGGFFSLSEPRTHVIESENGEPLYVESALNNFADLCSEVDGFVFLPDDEEISGEEYFWERNFIAYSIHVGQQIADKTIAEKPSVFVKSDTWNEHLDTFYSFCGGLIPELPQYLCSIVDDEEGVKKALASKFKEYSPHEIPNYQFREGGTKAPKDMFRVTVYCSATSTDAELKGSARDFSLEMGAMGFAVANGGGGEPIEQGLDDIREQASDGIMVETSDGVHEARTQFSDFLHDRGIKMPETHITSIHCEDTAQKEGLRDDNDYWCVWPNIFLRMQDLQDTDGEVVLAGGAGTLQEVCASILMRKYELTPTENRPLIIVNKNGIYDSFLKTIPEADKAKYNIHSVETEADALDILIEARNARGMEPDLPYDLKSMRALKEEYYDAFGYEQMKPKPEQIQKPGLPQQKRLER